MCPRGHGWPGKLEAAKTFCDSGERQDQQGEPLKLVHGSLAVTCPSFPNAGVHHWHLLLPSCASHVGSTVADACPLPAAEVMGTLCSAINTPLYYYYASSSLTCWHKWTALLTPWLLDQAGTDFSSSFPSFSKDTCTAGVERGILAGFLMQAAVVCSGREKW